MKHKIIFTAFTFFSILSFFAQPEINYLKENTFYFNVSESNIEGNGADILLKSIVESQFFILGEEHYSAKISEFTNAIIPFLAKQDYKNFVAEIGSNSATKITNLINNNGSLYNFNTEIYQLTGEIPIPFFDGKEDEMFLKNALNNNFKIWGIDQEYFTSQVFLIDEIYTLSTNKLELQSTYKQVKDYFIKETIKGVENEKYNLFTALLNSTLVEHFFQKTDTSNLKVQKIITDLKQSWKVYQLREIKDYYSSLHKRLEIMQKNFRDYYSEAKKVEYLPKAIIKIGGKHASKGRSLDNIFDIGNFVMEIANFNGKKSTTVLMFSSAYLNKNGSEDNNISKEDEIFLRPLINKANGKWTLINLKNIEAYSWKNKIEFNSLKDYMYRFDYLIITPPSKSQIPNYKNNN